MRAKTLSVLLSAAFTLPLVWARSASNVVLRINRIVNGNTKVVIDRNSAEVKVEDAK